MILVKINEDDSAYSIEDILNSASDIGCELPYIELKDKVMYICFHSIEDLRRMVYEACVIPIGEKGIEGSLPKYEEVNYVRLFSDGSALGNPGVGGWELY
jgi:hypothetical protein